MFAGVMTLTAAAFAPAAQATGAAVEGSAAACEQRLGYIKCGQYGTLLLGIDKDTKTGYKYAVGQANGTATVIQSLGKVQGTFGDPVYYRWASGTDPLNGD
jgi:hypothetical protein